MSNILIVYGNYNYPLRSTVKDHLYCFKRFSDDNTFYLNLAVRKVPFYILKVPIDLVIFHTTFLSKRWVDFNSFVNKARPLKALNAIKIILPQDEFIKTDMLCDFINEFEIDYVFTVAPESEWPKIYHKVDFQKVKFFKVLTGYLDDKTLLRIKKLEKSSYYRPIDIGYRAYGIRHWLGRHGFLKIKIADLFKDAADKYGLQSDISTDGKDTFYGDDWFRFLLKCKYTIGVEGGATILDRDGSIRYRTENYQANHPNATYEEIEDSCFPNEDGSLNLMAISPRHLEACATKTCQVLIEGKYNDILLPGRHYIELKHDFSNMDHVMDIIKKDEIRNTLTKQAYTDIVESEQYTYRSFVNTILEKILDQKKDSQFKEKLSFGQAFACKWMVWAETFSWIGVVITSTIIKLGKSFLPRTYNKLILRLMKK